MPEGNRLTLHDGLSGPPKAASAVRPDQSLTWRRYRIAENEWNLKDPPWRDAIGIEDIGGLDPDYAVPPVVAWLTRGYGQERFAQFLVDALNERREQFVRLLVDVSNRAGPS